MKFCCKWNHMDKSICKAPLDPDSPIWCTNHKIAADKVWENEDPRYAAARESKRKIEDVPVSESYL